MYDWEYEIIEFVRKLQLKKERLEKESKSFPEGFIVTSKRKGSKKTEYYHRICLNGKRTQTYLSPAHNQEFINLLLKKRHMMPEYNKEIHMIEKTYNQWLPVARKILSGIEMPKTKFPPFFSENSKKPEHLRYRTLREEVVRSISEKTIADTLYRYNLDYKYEKALQLGNTVIHPDFTIINPINGKTYYWEFLGLNTDEYQKTWDFKLARYSENNISKENYLIVSTMEEINSIEAVIRRNFTLERYKNIF